MQPKCSQNAAKIRAHSILCREIQKSRKSLETAPILKIMMLRKFLVIEFFSFAVRVREAKYLPAQRRRLLQSSANLSRSQRNLEWVKAKFKSLRSNLHEASVQLHNNANDGLCDPYISLRLVPSQKFLECPKHKTRVQRRTLFPLFDETFDL